MKTLREVASQFKNQLDILDLELIISHATGKSHEFVLAHPEHKLSRAEIKKTEKYLQQRVNHKPLAYITGQKEFYGLDFKVNKDVLIPRPETEMLVEESLKLLDNILRNNSHENTAVIDIGTGSGNIIISLAKNIKPPKLSGASYELLGIDISSKALRTAEYNAKKHKVDKKIKFIRSDLLNFILDTHLPDRQAGYQIPDTNLIILANLPYLSEKIYSSVSADIKKYEPASALLSEQDGLAHYKKLFQQIALLKAISYKLTAILEFSPEQKNKLAKLCKKYLPQRKIKFKKDLAGKWRLAIISRS